MAERVQEGEALAVDLSQRTLDGPDGVVWGLDSPQLNANLVKLDPGHQIGEHHYATVDVLIIVQSGDGVIVIDGVDHVVHADSVLLIPRGINRSIHATRRLVYYSIHMRRPGLDVSVAHTG